MIVSLSKVTSIMRIYNRSVLKLNCTSIYFIITLLREDRIMKIYTPFDPLLKYSICQKLLEWYYHRKIQRPCFLIKQNDRWTIVTYNL